MMRPCNFNEAWEPIINQIKGNNSIKQYNQQSKTPNIINKNIRKDNNESLTKQNKIYQNNDTEIDDESHSQSQLVSNGNRNTNERSNIQRNINSPSSQIIYNDDNISHQDTKYIYNERSKHNSPNTHSINASIRNSPNIYTKHFPNNQINHNCSESLLHIITCEHCQKRLNDLSRIYHGHLFDNNREYFNNKDKTNIFTNEITLYVVLGILFGYLLFSHLSKK